MLEDVADNLFNPDPYYQQGGDMVRAGGLSYACTPSETVGKRISDLKLDGGRTLEAGKSYKVAGWASVNAAAGHAGLGRGRQPSANRASRPTATRRRVTLIGVDDNPGIAGHHQ